MMQHSFFYSKIVVCCVDRLKVAGRKQPFICGDFQHRLSLLTASGSKASTAASSGWDLVEFEYDADSVNFNYWVNVAWDFDLLSYAAPTGTFASGTGTVEAVQLGAPNGMGGFTGEITFDAYEAHRTTSVGALLGCDAEGDVDIDINDVLAVVDEVFGNPVVLASGQPDCDINGSVNINDALGIVDIVF